MPSSLVPLLSIWRALSGLQGVWTLSGEAAAVFGPPYYRSGGQDRALTMSSTTFLASPNTIIVLSM